MASTETYTEAKQMEQQQQQQQHSEPHISKSTVLKVSIHCEGCKRKVKKILQGVHGVYDINIDLRQQKVVVTGNVTSDILIRKLTKAGKHVELWPEQPDSKNNKKKKKQDEKPQKQNDPENDSEINESGVNDNETGKIKVDETSKNVQSSSNTAKNNDGSGAVTGVVQVQEPKVAEVVRQTVVLPAGPVPEKKVNVAVQFPNENEEASANEKIGGANNNNGGGGGNKKKKKKGKVMMNNNNGNESVPVTAASTATVNVEHCGEAPVNAGSGYRSQGQGQGHFHGTVHPGSVPFSNPANESPPRHHMHYQQYPPNYYAPPPVHAHATASVCTMSHHAAYPSSSSYGAAYYAPPQPYSYAHVVRPGTGEMVPRPYTYESESYSYTSSQPSDSFEFFSDENPNACSVM